MHCNDKILGEDIKLFNMTSITSCTNVYYQNLFRLKNRAARKTCVCLSSQRHEFSYCIEFLTVSDSWLSR